MLSDLTLSNINVCAQKPPLDQLFRDTIPTTAHSSFNVLVHMQVRNGFVFSLLPPDVPEHTTCVGHNSVILPMGLSLGFEVQFWIGCLN